MMLRNIFIGAIASLIIPVLPASAGYIRILTTPTTRYYIDPNITIQDDSATTRVRAIYNKPQTTKYTGKVFGQDRYVNIECKGKKELTPLYMHLLDNKLLVKQPLGLSSKLARWDKRLNAVVVNYTCNEYNKVY